MKTLGFGAAVLALLAGASLSPAIAEGPKPSGGNSWSGMSQPADAGATNPAAITPHYELRYHYAGHHARWVGQWVLVR